jgi:hypothetical protein
MLVSYAEAVQDRVRWSKHAHTQRQKDVFLGRLYSKDSDVHAVLRRSKVYSAYTLANVGCLLECALLALRGSSVDAWECGFVC